MTNKEYVDAVKNRIAVRTYQKELLGKEDIELLKEIVDRNEKLSGPFNNNVELTFNLNYKDIDGRKIGTYGFIKNAPAYIGGVCENKKEVLIDFGYIFHNVVLELVHNGYSTCWVGGTFNRNQYRKSLGDHEVIPAICPLGHAATKRSLIDRMIKKDTMIRKRKQLNENFFDETKQLSADMKEVFSYVRQAPSAMNKQPWIMVMNGDYIHVYLEGTSKKSNSTFDIRMLDIGIAIKHLEIGIEYKKYNYERVILDDVNFKNHEYIISYKLSK